MRFPRPVVCVWCGNRHRSVVPGRGDQPSTTQGDACAASVWVEAGVWYVQAHYGSSDYDTRRYRFVANPPAEPADPVCDNCIGERLCAGDLERVDGTYL